MPTHSRKTILLATDQQQSVLNSLDTNGPRAIVYTPYGHRPRENGLLSLIGFNGQLPDALTGHYHLGNGYRQFNPVLMRFNSPDSWSPFGDGGLNAYAYCGGDPRNRTDPTGHVLGIGTALAKKGLGWKTTSTKTSPVSKKVAMGNISSAKNGSLPSTNAATTTRASSAPKKSHLGLVSHPDDVTGSADYQKWLMSQAKNRQKIQAIKSKDTPFSEPHSSKHIFQKNTSPTKQISEPSFEDFLSSASDADLSHAYAEILESTRHGAFPRELKIGISMQQEVIRRTTARSIR